MDIDCGLFGCTHVHVLTSKEFSVEFKMNVLKWLVEYTGRILQYMPI